MRRGCPVCESRKTRGLKTLFKSFEFAVIQTLPQAYRHQEYVINAERYLRLGLVPSGSSTFRHILARLSAHVIAHVIVHDRVPPDRPRTAVGKFFLSTRSRELSTFGKLNSTLSSSLVNDDLPTNICRKAIVIITRANLRYSFYIVPDFS
jgi:hypothetical protein